jgi:hypothetical protein
MKYVQMTDSSNRKFIINLAKFRHDNKRDDDTQSCTSIEFRNGKCL